MEITPIEPPITKQPKPKVYDGMNIQITNMVLNTSATFKVYLFTGGTLVEQKRMYMLGQEYQQWTTDDYLIQWVIAQLEAENVY